MPCKQLHNNRGSTLLMVIIVFAMLLIFGMAAIALSANAHRNAVTDYQTQQAYFTARSAVLAAVDYVKAAPDPKALLESLQAIGTSEKTVDPQLGSYDLTVKKLDDTHYELVSTAEVDGKMRRMSVILQLDSAGFPFGENLVTATGFDEGTSSVNGGADIYGNLMIKMENPFSLPAGITVHGDLYIDSEQPVTITGGPKVEKYNDTTGGNLYINNSIHLEGVSVKVAGNIYCQGDFTAAGGGLTTSDDSLILVGGNMGGSSFSISKPKNIVVWGNGDFRNCTLSTQLNRIFFGGTYQRYQYDTTFSGLTVFENYSPEKNGYEMPDMNYSEPIDELHDLVNYATYEAFVDTFKNKEININGGWKDTYTVAESGTLGSVLNFNGTINVDTSAGDVHWYITNSSVSALGTCNVRVVGDNQLILHFAKGVKLDSLSYTNLGLTGADSEITKDTKPQICIVAPYGKTPSQRNEVVLGGSAKLAAYVIMPYGRFTATGGTTFAGNMIVGSSTLDAGAKLYYQTPNYPTIPGIGEITVGGGGGGGTGGGVSLLGVYTTRPE